MEETVNNQNSGPVFTGGGNPLDLLDEIAPKDEGGNQIPTPEVNQVNNPNTVEQPTVDDKTNEQPAEKTVTSSDAWSGLSDFNERFGLEFESEDQIREYFDSEDEYDVEEYQRQTTELKAQNDKLRDMLRNSRDPRKLFANEDQYKMQQIINKNPTLNPSIAAKVVSGSVNSMSDIDAIVNAQMIKYGNIDGVTFDGLKNRVLRSAGLEEDMTMDDLSESQKLDIKLQAADARDKLNSLGEGLEELGESTDIDELLSRESKEFEERNTRLKENWSPKINETLYQSGIISFDLKDELGDDSGFSFDFDDKQLTEIEQQLVQIAADQGIDIDDENFGDAMDGLMQGAKGQLVLKNLPDIISKAVKYAVSRTEEKWHKQIHNDSNPNKVTNVNNNVNTDNWENDLMNLSY